MQPTGNDPSPVATPRRRRAFSRRLFLATGAGGAIALGVGGWQWWSGFAGSRARWVESAVRKNLRGVVLDQDSLARFVQAVLAGRLIETRTQGMAVFAHRAAPWLTQRIPKVRQALETRERQVLTEYLIGSNFFHVVDPRREPIVWYGAPVACGNPWASFS